MKKIFIGFCFLTVFSGLCFDQQKYGLALAFGIIAVVLFLSMFLEYLTAGSVIKD